MLFRYLQKDPLTECQSQACQSEALTTLVLAGAGTGKTSTLMGRIVYLWETQQALPEEILPLAFAVDAAQELQQRLENVVKVHFTPNTSTDAKENKVKARTFHSLGWHIVQTVENISPKLTIYHEEQVLHKFLKKQFEYLLHYDVSYRRLLFQYFTFYEQVDEITQPYDQSIDKYVDQDLPRCYNERQYNSSVQNKFSIYRRSLNDDYVSSQAELVIANLLYLLGIPYIYRAHYLQDIYLGKSSQPYCCRFYLPQCHTYIELEDELSALHKGTYPITKVQQYIPYQCIHQQHGTQCIFIDKIWVQNLVQQGIGLYDVDLKIPFSHSTGRLDNLFILLQQLFSNVKAKGITSDTLKQNLAISKVESSDSQSTQLLMAREEVMYALLKPLLAAYEQELQRRGEMDFDGMILKATYYIERGAFEVPWKEVLIDEFQDISQSRLALIQSMRRQKPYLRLFCVGDDWQTIYQFAGSELQYIRYIERYFGETKKISLDKTFRFHQGICDMSSQFIQQNPMQYCKTLSALREVAESIVLVAYDVDKYVLFGGAENSVPFTKEKSSLFILIKAIVQDILNTSPSSPLTCLILARFQHNLPGEEQPQYWQQIFPCLSFRATTIHASKGTEADFVIILNVEQGEYGLPSEKQAVQRGEERCRESFPYAEERRVFYVAVTRARERVYLCYQKHNPSIFIQELQQYQPLRKLSLSENRQQHHVVKILSTLILHLRQSLKRLRLF